MESTMDRPRSRKQTWLRAAGFGFLYGSVQAILPPIPLVWSDFVLIAFLAVFIVSLKRARRSRPATAAAVAAYVLVLVLASYLPFKFMDTRVQLRAEEVSIDEIRRALDEHEGMAVLLEEPLPARNIRLPTARPSLKQIREALHEQANLDLRRLAGCGNAYSVSFLWGWREAGTLFVLRPRPVKRTEL